MSIFDQGGRLDTCVVFTPCAHGKDGGSCPLCAVEVARANVRELTLTYFADLEALAAIRVDKMEKLK